METKRCTQTTEFYHSPKEMRVMLSLSIIKILATRCAHCPK